MAGFGQVERGWYWSNWAKYLRQRAAVCIDPARAGELRRWADEVERLGDKAPIAGEAPATKRKRGR